MTAEEFLQISAAFRLGDLPTEQAHPETVGMAEQAQQCLPQAVEAFNRVDRMAFASLQKHLDPLPDLVEAIRSTLRRGHRIYIAGCGATGRLALALEVLARDVWCTNDPDRVRGFMAGGDAALIRSIESFEDYPDYGARQLNELGFAREDLLIGITEGGETPFVLGAVMEATRFNGPKPWCLFCNPPDLLKTTVARSREMITHPGIRPFPLPIGPMALSGSTRLQATSVQMLVAGAALSEATGHASAAELMQAFQGLLQEFDPHTVIPFIEAEAAVYAAKDQVLYTADLFAITVLTDTTERSPTFSLPPFESRDHAEEPSSTCYLSIPGTDSTQSAWRQLLRRAPRALDWKGISEKARLKYLLAHDISENASQWRKQRCPAAQQIPYVIGGPAPTLRFMNHTQILCDAQQPLLLRHLLLKVSLNMQSTLVMGRLGRFESNLMTWVKPANNKLIDRAARYRQLKHQQIHGTPLPYPDAVRQVFDSL
jgi:N-acetylmuramic acid 6-phosphate etherase